MTKNSNGTQSARVVTQRVFFSWKKPQSCHWGL